MALAIIFMDATGNRACSLVKSTEHEHTVLSSQVTVIYTDAGGQERVVRGGSLEVRDIIAGQETEVSITVLTSKVRKVSPITCTFTPSDERSIRLIRCVSEYMKYSGAGPHDPFLTYLRRSEKRDGLGAWSKRSVKASDINLEIKRSAVVNGFPAQHFSTKSYRLQLATKNQLAGVPEEETCKVGGWLSSKTMKGSYDKSRGIAHGRDSSRPLSGGQARSNDARLSSEQVALMLTAENRSAKRSDQAHADMLNRIAEARR